jgi:hypothetical protein
VADELLLEQSPHNYAYLDEQSFDIAILEVCVVLRTFSVTTLIPGRDVTGQRKDRISSRRRLTVAATAASEDNLRTAEGYGPQGAKPRFLDTSWQET